MFLIIFSLFLLVEGWRSLVGVVREHELPDLPAWYWKRSAFLDRLRFVHVMRLLGACLVLVLGVVFYPYLVCAGPLLLGLLGSLYLQLLF